jgi:hypothetical protein
VTQGEEWRRRTEGMEIADAVEKTRLVALLEFDAEYNILICKEHGYAVRNLDTHLRDEHSMQS